MIYYLPLFRAPTFHQIVSSSFCVDFLVDWTVHIVLNWIEYTLHYFLFGLSVAESFIKLLLKMNVNHAASSIAVAPSATVLDSGLPVKHPAFLDINTINPTLGGGC